jgi:uncharacterized protein
VNKTGEAQSSRDSSGVIPFVALAWATTWILAIPALRAWMAHAAPSPLAVACAGLSAFGPLIAVLLVAGPRHQLGPVFGRWRTPLVWIAVALFTPFAIHLIATVLFVAIGGVPDTWFHPPTTSEQVAALVVFPLGEEFGWRGFLHPRLVGRYGLVWGSLLVGLVWGIWHLAYAVTPTAGTFDPMEFGMTLVELPLYSLLIAWVFERANRSMAVAIAFHAGGHLDHLEHASRADLRLHGIHMLVLAIAAVVAARLLSSMRANTSAQSEA